MEYFSYEIIPNQMQIWIQALSKNELYAELQIKEATDNYYTEFINMAELDKEEVAQIKSELLDKGYNYVKDKYKRLFI